MSPRVRVPPEEDGAPPPPQPANTRTATTSADINASNLLLTLINLPSSANNSRCTQVPTSVRHCRIRSLTCWRLFALATNVSAGRYSAGQSSSRLSPGRTRLGLLTARKDLPGALPVPPRQSASDAVQHDGDNHDANPTDEADPDVELAQARHDRLAETPRPGQTGDDHHREREHDYLIDPGHDRLERERKLHLEERLPGGGPEGMCGLHRVLGHLLNAEHRQPHGGRHGEDDRRDQGWTCPDPQQHNGWNQVHEGRHRLRDVEDGTGGRLDCAHFGRDDTDRDAYCQRNDRRRQDQCQGLHRRLPQIQADYEYQAQRGEQSHPPARQEKGDHAQDDDHEQRGGLEEDILHRANDEIYRGGEEIERTIEVVGDPLDPALGPLGQRYARDQFRLQESQHPLLPCPVHTHPIAGLGGSVGANIAEAPVPFIVRLDARCQTGDERATDDDAFETLAFAHDGHGRVRVLYGFAKTHQAPLAIQHAHVGQAGLPHPPQDDRGPLVDVSDLLRLDHYTLGLAHLGVVHVLDEALHVLVRRLPQNVFRGAELYYLAVLHDRHPVPERERLVQVVGDEDDRPLGLALDIQEEVLHVAPNQRVERRERLVHEQYLLLGRKGPRETHPLLHAAGELCYELVALALEADHVEGLLRALPALFGGDALNLESEGDVVQHGPVWQEPEVLEDHPYLLAPDLPKLLGRHP